VVGGFFYFFFSSFFHFFFFLKGDDGLQKAGDRGATERREERTKAKRSSTAPDGSALFSL